MPMSEIHIYDVIDRWGSISSAAVSRALVSVTGDVVVRINSIGGDALEGVSIYNALRRYDKGNVSVEVDGVAASAASIIAMAGHEIRIAPGAMMMIHNPHTFTIGGADDHEAQALMLRKVAAEMAKIYAARSGQSEKKCLAIMADETWLGAEEAQSLGFCDVIVASKQRIEPVEESSSAARVAATYKNAPASLQLILGGKAQQPGKPEVAPAPSPKPRPAAALIATPLSQLSRRSY